MSGSCNPRTEEFCGPWRFRVFRTRIRGSRFPNIDDPPSRNSPAHRRKPKGYPATLLRVRVEGCEIGSTLQVPVGMLRYGSGGRSVGLGPAPSGYAAPPGDLQEERGYFRDVTLASYFSVCLYCLRDRRVRRGAILRDHAPVRTERHQPGWPHCWRRRGNERVYTDLGLPGRHRDQPAPLCRRCGYRDPTDRDAQWAYLGYQ